MDTPYDVLGSLGSFGGLRGPTPLEAWNQGVLGAQTTEQNNNILAQQRAEAQKQQMLQQRQQQYQQDLSALPQGNMFLGMSRMIAKYPEFKEALKASYDSFDEQTQRGELRHASTVWNLLKNGFVDKAIEQLETRVRSDRNAGGYQTGAGGANTGEGSDPSFFEGQLKLLKTGNPKAIAAVKDGLASFMATVIPDKFANVSEQLGIGKDGKRVMRPGDVLLGEDDKPIYTTPFAPQTVTVEPGKKVVEFTPGGGGSATDDASGGRRFTGGWTPRARNGGDNEDAAVDGKIAGASQYLGVAPTADLTGMSPLKIAQAMTLSEGGKGSLADRNNNPANIKGAGGEGGFRKFPTKVAGLNAAAALVARKIRSGQTTVQSLIEGLPVDGGQAGISRVIADGGPPKAKPQGVRMTPAENEAEGLPTNIIYYRNEFGVPVPVGGQKPGSPDKSGAYSQSALDAFDRAIDTAQRLVGAPAVRDKSGKVVRGAIEPHPGLSTAVGVKGLTGGFLGGWVVPGTDAADFNAELDAMKAQVFLPMVQSMKGMGALSNAEGEKLTAAIGALSPQQSEVQFKKSVNRIIDDLRTYKQRGISGSVPGDQPVRVSSVQQAMSLKPGTVFITPDGRRKVR